MQMVARLNHEIASKLLFRQLASIALSSCDLFTPCWTGIMWVARANFLQGRQPGHKWNLNRNLVHETHLISVKNASHNAWMKALKAHHSP